MLSLPVTVYNLKISAHLSLTTNTTLVHPLISYYHHTTMLPPVTHYYYHTTTLPPLSLSGTAADMEGTLDFAEKVGWMAKTDRQAVKDAHVEEQLAHADSHQVTNPVTPLPPFTTLLPSNPLYHFAAISLALSLSLHSARPLSI